MRAVWCLVIAGLALMLAAPAGAQVHTVTERASGFDVAVDAGGTAHVVWSADGRPDVLQYCRIRRGGSTCDVSHRLGAVDQEFGPPLVVVTPANEIVVASHRCCSPATFGGDLDGAQLFVSEDGGTTFSAGAHPLRGPAQRAAFGPGDFAISTAGGGAEGTWWHLLPFGPGGGAVQSVQLATLASEKIFDASAGLLDPATPVAAYGDGDRVYLRRHDGSGPYGNPANWGREVVAGEGRAAQLASSPLRGAYLLMHAGARGDERVVVRRVTATGLGPAVNLGAVPVGGASSGFAQDFAGNLHVAVATLGGLVYRGSSDGTTFSRARLLAPARSGEGGIHSPQVAAASDGSGVALFKEGPDRLRFVAFRGSGGQAPGSGCGTQVRVGAAIVQALEGSFRARGRTCVVRGAVKVNGVDVEPLDGRALTVVVDRRARTLTTRERANVRVGGVTLHRERVEWKLPRRPGPVTDFPDLGRYAKELLGFPVDGDADFDLTSGGATIRTSFRLPALLGGVTADVALRTDRNGLRLQNLRVHHRGPLQAGLLRIRDLDIRYSADPSVFTGTATFLLPPAYANTPRLEVNEIRFEDGEFVRGAFTVGLPAPLPLVAVPAPLLSLRDLAFEIETRPALRLAGGALFLAGPQAGGGGLLQVDALPRNGGGISFTFPRGDAPAVLRVGGRLNLLGALPFASAAAEFRTNGFIRFGGGLRLDDVPGLLIEGRIPEERTFVDLERGRFNAEFVARVCVPAIADVCPTSAQAVLSSRGIAACATLPPPFPPIEVGGFYRWGETLPRIPFCDLDPVRVQAGAAQARAFTLPAGLPQAAVILEGATGPPQVTLTAPDGQTLATPAPGQRVIQGRSVAYTLPERRQTVIQVAQPPAGRWRVDGAVTRLSLAEGRADPEIDARVTGRGQRRLLRYRIRGAEGQRVTFLETANGAAQQLGSTTKAQGTIAFRPASGPAGRREIVAFVEQDGLPRDRLAVTGYRAPAAAGPPRPRRVRLRRAGSRLVVRWTRVRGAREYEVRVTLPVDGRRLLLRTRRTRVTIPRLEREDRARVRVAAVGEDLVVGRARSASLRRSSRRR